MRRRPANPFALAQGFTLLELLIVVAIIGLAIGVVVTHGPMRSQGLEARAAAGTLAQTLRIARAQAIARSQNVSVLIDPNGHSFAADLGPIHRLAPDTDIAVLPGTLVGPHGTSMLRFSPDGSASGGGVTLGRGARALTISVEWLTGRVKVANAAE
jgi:general secretion pathway protein H